MIKKILTIALLTTSLSGCLATLDKNASKLNVAFEWTEKSRCSAISPPISVTNIPENAKFLSIRMVDLNVPSFNHGGGEIAYTGGSSIQEGALKNFNGPCPPGAAHRYEITVQALNADKKVIVGQGSAIRQFPK